MMIAVLNKLFAGPIEQIRVADLERALKRTVSDDELWSYHHAGVFKYNYSLIYDYDRNATPPTEIIPRARTDIEIAAAKLKTVKEKRVKKSKPKVGREAALQRAARNAIDTTKYAHLDNGRLAMTVNNILRGREKRGEPVTW
jgi:hypothetical protein